MSDPAITVRNILEAKLFRALEAQRRVALQTGIMRREATPEAALVRKILGLIWEFERRGAVPSELFRNESGALNRSEF